MFITINKTRKLDIQGASNELKIDPWVLRAIAFVATMPVTIYDQCDKRE